MPSTMEFLQEISATADVSFGKTYLLVSKPILNERNQESVILYRKKGDSMNTVNIDGAFPARHRGPRSVGSKARSRSVYIWKGAIRMIPMIAAMCNQEGHSVMNDIAKHDTRSPVRSQRSTTNYQLEFVLIYGGSQFAIVDRGIFVVCGQLVGLVRSHGNKRE